MRVIIALCRPVSSWIVFMLTLFSLFTTISKSNPRCQAVMGLNDDMMLLGRPVGMNLAIAK
jgi:hypothetical protein